MNSVLLFAALIHFTVC